MVTAGIAGIFDGNSAGGSGWMEEQDKCRSDCDGTGMSDQSIFYGWQCESGDRSMAVENRLLSDCDCAVF